MVAVYVEVEVDCVEGTISGCKDEEDALPGMADT